MPKTVVMTVSEKGGTGKSVLARYLADLYQRKDVPATLIDTDGDVGQLFQYHGKTVIQCNAATLPKLIDLIDEADTSVILIDMPGRGLADLNQLQSEYDLLGFLKRRNIALTMLNVISPFRASTRSVTTMIAFAKEQARYVAVLNRWYAEKDQALRIPYALWYGDEHRDIPQAQSRQKLLEHQGQEVTLPRLSSDIMALIDLESLTYTQAATQGAEHGLAMSDRQAITTWLRATDEAFATLLPWLGIP